MAGEGGEGDGGLGSGKERDLGWVLGGGGSRFGESGCGTPAPSWDTISSLLLRRDSGRRTNGGESGSNTSAAFADFASDAAAAALDGAAAFASDLAAAVAFAADDGLAAGFVDGCLGLSCL